MKCFISVDRLNTDYSYQRDLAENRVRKITKEFSPDLLGIITISQREDGRLFIIDGNHRVEAAKRCKVPQLFAEVFIGLTREQEAELFVKLNSGQKSPSFNDKLRAKIEAKDPQSVAYLDILNASGIAYTFKKGDKNKFQAHKAGLRILSTYGPDRLLKTFKIMGECNMNTDSRSFAGLAVFLDAKNIDMERLYKTLKRTSVDDLYKIQSAYNYSSSSDFNSTSARAMAMAIATMYDKGLSKNSKYYVSLDNFDHILLSGK